MLTDICFQHADWTPQPPRENSKMAWANKQGVVIQLQLIGKDKTLRSLLSDVTAVRNHYRASFTAQGMGLIECDTILLDDLCAVGALGKIILQPTHAVYIGKIALPLPRESYVFNVAAKEIGITGMREAALFAKTSVDLEKQGYALDLPSEKEPGKPSAPMGWRQSETGVLLRWAQDPYAPEFNGPCLRNLADAPEHDAGFPNHPLSQVRAALRCLKENVKLSPSLQKRAQAKPGWRFW